MGILNLTDDSFYEASRTEMGNLLAKATEMIRDGADILDLGAQSTRPGALEIPANQERQTIASGVARIREAFPEILISVDTFRAEVAEAGMKAGADIINDISGGNRDEAIWEVAATHGAPYILMHSRGDSQTMMKLNKYADVTRDVISELSQKVFRLKSIGVCDVIIDPGFGFAKGPTQNFELLRNLEHFKVLELPLLIGLSRKSLIYKTLNINPEDSLNGTSVLNTFALERGASILRVHDIKPAKETIALWTNLHPAIQDIG